ncbi:E3 Ubiquitin ligase protein [Halorhabdus tiamatea SARL4B]|uniref:E3 Ubiquitin ligase protein n=1 Tax=Halorhabdus tiamatea SARL4B TaxID=1033806 RepID=U2DGW8_9EURY|nr:hypothetical protein [Halorhabdus tiamatea]ERJ05257.1 E3 Ubiquitin ligase protein [Halorhabdus tiamatea SARL4B]
MFGVWNFGGTFLQLGIGTIGRWVLFVVLLGLFLVPALYIGITYFRQWLGLRGTAGTSVAEAANTDGFVALEGTAVTDDPIEPALADERSVAAKYYLKAIAPLRVAHEWNPRKPIESPLESGANFSTPWRTVDEGQMTTAFWLEDDTGRVRVEPEDASVYVSGGKVHAEVDSRQDLESQLSDVDEDEIVRDKREIYDGKGEIITFVWSVLNWRDRWYREGHIGNGEQVFVAGPVETDQSGPAESGTVNAVVRSDGSGRPFVVTNRSGNEHTNKLLYVSLVIFAVGAVFIGLVGWGLLQTV